MASNPEATESARRGARQLLTICGRAAQEPRMTRAIDSAADLDLVASLQRGEAGALDTLATRHGQMIYRLAFGITRNQGDAEEVLQDVLLTLARRSASFEGRSALGSWIYRIATNTALNKRRGKRLELETPLEDLLPTFEADGHRSGDRTYLLADWSQNPEEELLAGERRRVLEQAIDSLPDHYRVVLILRDVEGFSNDEVSTLLGEPVSSVKSRLHRARMV